MSSNGLDILRRALICSRADQENGQLAEAYWSRVSEDLAGRLRERVLIASKNRWPTRSRCPLPT